MKSIAITICLLFSISNSIAKSSEKIKLDRLDEQQSDNLLELSGSGVLIGSAAVYGKANFQQSIKLNITMLEDIEKHKQLTAIVIKKQNNKPTVKSLKKQRFVLEAKMEKNNSKITRNDTLRKFNYGLLGAGTLSAFKNLWDVFDISSDMKEMIDCNPELLYRAAPLKREHTVNFIDVLNTAKKID